MARGSCSGATLSASSTEGGSSLSNLTDGNASTYWRANGTTEPHYIQIDFGSAQTVDQWDLTTRNDSGYANDAATILRVEGSANASDWTTVRAITRGSGAWAQGVLYRFGMPGAAARYWRFTSYSTTRGYFSMGEWEMRATAGGSNVVGSGTGTASSSFAPSTNGPGIVFDGVGLGSNYWVSATNSGTHWLQYDFGSAQALQEMNFWLRGDGFGAGDAPLSWSFDASHDGSTFVNMGDYARANWSEGRYFTYFLPGYEPNNNAGTAYRYWKLLFVTNGGYVNAAEIQGRTSFGGANQFTGGSVTAFSELTSYEATKALDGNTATFWATNGSFLNNIDWNYDLGSGVTKAIRQLLYRTRDSGYAPTLAGLLQLHVKASNDGSTYVYVGSFNRENADFAQATDYLFNLSATDAPAVSNYRRRFAGIIG